MAVLAMVTFLKLSTMDTYIIFKQKVLKFNQSRHYYSNINMYLYII